MTSTDKLVFISYRRSTSKAYARLIFDRLRAAGFDAYLDTNTADNGVFDPVTLSQIGARPHFVLLVSPGTFGSCHNKDDWLRLEIEEAIKLERNVIPLVDVEMDFDLQVGFLPMELREKFRSYSGIPFMHPYFNASLDRLVSRLAELPTDGIKIVASSPDEQQEARQRIEQIAVSPTLTPEQLAADEIYGRAHNKYLGDASFAELIADYTEAIRLNPQFAAAYHHRGIVWRDQYQHDNAIADYNEAIRLNPEFAAAYFARGWARREQGDIDGAIADFTEVIRHNPYYDEPFHERHEAYKAKGDLDGQITNYTEWIQFYPRLAKDLYNGRGNVHLSKGNYDDAITDFSEVISLDLKYATAYSNRGEAYFAKGMYEDALKDFKQADVLEPNYQFPIGGLAITYHALGQVEEAKRWWHRLLALNNEFKDVESVSTELNWAEPLVEEARKLIAKL